MNDSRKFLKISTDNTARIIEMPEKDFLNSCYRHIGCDYIEICTPCPDIGLRMIIDDSGKINDQPYNPLATLLYNHPDIIFGNVIVGMLGENDDGEQDIVGLSEEMIDRIFLFLYDLRIRLIV